MMTIKPGYCACGKPLHYINKNVEKIVRRYAKELGEMVEITAPSGTFLVQRHYIALHGIEAKDLNSLAIDGVVERTSKKPLHALTPEEKAELDAWYGSSEQKESS
jgi:isopentenyldiphosphate isomerase